MSRTQIFILLFYKMTLVSIQKNIHIYYFLFWILTPLYKMKYYKNLYPTLDALIERKMSRVSKTYLYIFSYPSYRILRIFFLYTNVPSASSQSAYYHVFLSLLS